MAKTAAKTATNMGTAMAPISGTDGDGVEVFDMACDGEVVWVGVPVEAKVGAGAEPAIFIASVFRLWVKDSW